ADRRLRPALGRGRRACDGGEVHRGGVQDAAAEDTAEACADGDQEEEPGMIGMRIAECGPRNAKRDQTSVARGSTGSRRAVSWRRDSRGVVVAPAVRFGEPFTVSSSKGERGDAASGFNVPRPMTSPELAAISAFIRCVALMCVLAATVWLA